MAIMMDKGSITFTNPLKSKPNTDTKPASISPYDLPLFSGNYIIKFLDTLIIDHNDKLHPTVKAEIEGLRGAVCILCNSTKTS